MGNALGRGWAAPIRRVIDPAAKVPDENSRSMILNRNLPTPKFSTGVGLGMLPTNTKHIIGNTDNSIVQTEPKRRNPRDIFNDLGSKEKKLAVSETILTKIMVTTETSRKMMNLENIGFHPIFG